MKKKVTNLREALFDTLEKFRNDEITVEKAKQICSIAQTIINSAEVETNFIKAINSKKGSGFFQNQSIRRQKLIPNTS